MIFWVTPYTPRQVIAMPKVQSERYRGYWIGTSPFSGLYFVTRDGQHVCTCDSLAEAKAAIDVLVD